MAHAAKARGTMSTGEHTMQESIESPGTEALASILPHGGRLVSRMLTGEARTDAIGRAQDLPAISLNARAVSDVECLATGVFSPLEGFMDRGDYEGVVNEMRLKNGILWTLPITLAAPKADAAELREGGAAA